jgi:hypothetical protein
MMAISPKKGISPSSPCVEERAFRWSIAKGDIHSQRHEGWHILKTIYDEGGFSGGNLNGPALERLLQDVSEKKIDVVVVYKVVYVPYLGNAAC